MADFVPRLDSSGMAGSKYYYSDNVFYPSYGLPNCTCYAWGRFYEISDVRPHLPTGDAGTWWRNVSGYETGSEPRLGAVACMDGGPYSGLGHVAVVEQLNSDGTITCSNSAWGGTYFYLTSGSSSNSWGYSEYSFQGFIYNPNAPSGTLSGSSGRTVSIDYTKLNPYIVTLHRTTPTSIDYAAMKSKGVVGGIIDGGQLYDEKHSIQSVFRNPNLYDHVLKLNSNGLQYGYYFNIFARNISEIEQELYQMSFPIRKYPPTLGVWLKPHFYSSDKSTNDSLLSYYKSGLYRLGLKSKIGLYTGKGDLDTINWSKHYDEWFLWLVKHIDSKDEIDKLLDPTFFDMEGQYT